MGWRLVLRYSHSPPGDAGYSGMVVAVRGTGFRAMEGNVCCRGAGLGRGDVVNAGDMCDVGDVGDVADMGESGALLELPPE